MDNFLSAIFTPNPINLFHELGHWQKKKMTEKKLGIDYHHV
jgi:hypothetical protein